MLAQRIVRSLIKTQTKKCNSGSSLSQADHASTEGIREGRLSNIRERNELNIAARGKCKLRYIWPDRAGVTIKENLNNKGKSCARK